MTSRSFAWLATDGGVWALPSNWNDLTDGIDPSQIAPGAQDSVSVLGESGAGIGIITGPGSALFAAFAGNDGLSGIFGFGTLTLGADSAGGLLDIEAASDVTAATGTIASGSLLASAEGGSFGVTGTLTLGAGQIGLGAAACNLDATDGGTITATALLLDASSAAIYVDPSSVIEVGGTGVAARGALTIDAGADLSGQGDANSYADMLNDGTVTAIGGDLRVGTVTGLGQLNIATGATLTVNGPTAVGETIGFNGASGTLAISTEYDAPSGAISGFAIGDAIDFLGSPISTATYVGSGGNSGVLTLTYGGQVAATLTLQGNYSNDVFLTAGDGDLGTIISVAAGTSGGGTLSGGTKNPDQYQWVASSGGAWDQAANWEDVTTGAAPPAVAPGHNNLVTIAAAQSSWDVIAGPAAAASLSLTGEVALGGAFTLGTLTVGDGAAETIGTVDLLSGTTLTAGTAAIADGALSLAGSGTTLSVTTSLILGGGVSGIGLPVTYLTVNGGAVVTAATLTLGGGSGDYVTTDSTGSVEIGGAAGAAPGAVTVDAIGTLSGNGQVNPFGAIVDNGTISAEGGGLVLGSVTGTGVLDIGASAELTLDGGTALPIDFTGASATLAFTSELVASAGTITGFTPGETIDVENDTITNVSFTASTLTLYYDSAAVASLTLAGSYAHDSFVLVSDGALGTDIEVTSNGGTGGGGGSGTDVLAWTTPGSGAWGDARNWTDLTTGKRSSAPPGSGNQVQVAGFTDGEFQDIGGPGTCAGVTFTGNTALTGAYSFGTLILGSSGTAGALVLEPGADVAVAGQADIAEGTMAVNGTGTSLTVSGTLSIGGGAEGTGTANTALNAGNAAYVQAAALTIGGGDGAALATDGTASIEIGTLGHAAAGAVTIDHGIQVQGNGTINPVGAVVDNGTLAPAGGTLVVGNVTGTGTLSIQEESVLELAGTDACAIVFGAAATLLLQGSSETPAGIISSFAAGDAIVTGTSQVTQVTYAPGTGNVGTLTLYYDNQVAGTLLLAGSYAGDVFILTPDGQGTDIGVQQSSGGPSAGTTTPDDYVWTGAGGDDDWNNNANWEDVSADQDPAEVAPGLNDIDTVQGPTGNSFLTLNGPANAATLTLLGNVALTQPYTIGVLQIGAVGSAGTLELGPAAEVLAEDVTVIGSIVGEGGLLAVNQTLTLGGAGGSGVLTASNDAAMTADALVLAGTGSAVAVLGNASIEIGQAEDPIAGALTVDAGSYVSGAGALDITGQIIDNGTIAASGGTLSVGTLTGSGLLQIDVGATLALYSAPAGITIAFAGPGALIVAPGDMPASDIADFNQGDSILVPFTGITDAEYAQTAPGIGTLTLFNGTTAEAALTLLGVGLGQTFAVTPLDGETEITTQQENTQTGGGGGMGQGEYTNGPDTDFVSGEPTYLQPWLEKAMSQGNDFLTAYLDVSAEGAAGTWNPSALGYANIAIVTNPVAYSKVALPPQQYPGPNYVALLAEGGTPVLLTDDALGNALIAGNQGADTIVGNGNNDTLVGGNGQGNVLFDVNNATIIGESNDTIVTGQGNTDIVTSTGRSLLFVGAADNLVQSNGTDTICAAPGSIANETVYAAGNAVLFGAAIGQVTFHAGAGVCTVVGAQGGTLRMYGGSGNGSTLWASGIGSFAQYFGGQGTATVVGGAGELYVQGGTGAVTVFGGTGQAEIFGTAGPSTYVIGDGASTVTAATGNSVWLAGAANESLVASGGDILFYGKGSSGANVYQAGSGPVTIIGGTGDSTFIAGNGAATMEGGLGADIFSFTSGITGGPLADDTIENFQVGKDIIALNGYAGGVQAVLDTQKISGDTTSYTLPDGTHLVLQGIAGLSASSFTST